MKVWCIRWLVALPVGAGFVSTFPQQRSCVLQGSSKLSAATPSLVVFDLDNTLWTPELYQLRKLQRADVTPIAGRDVKLFSGAESFIQSIRASPDDWQDTAFAVASRTKSVSWAHDLIGQFGLEDFFHHVEIFPGDKQRHFESLQKKTGVPYKEMLFFDDSRDGKYGNCVPVSQLGVLSVHCPGGIHSEDVFHTGMAKFAEWTGAANTIVEWDGTVSQLQEQQPLVGKAGRGIVKMVNSERRFGFIRHGDSPTKDLFFHFNNLPQKGRGEGQVDKGDKLSFTIAKDPKNGKLMATDIKNLSPAATKPQGQSADTVTMRVFSMNLPFAALLANEYKTLETRNGTMFVPYPEGTKMLLHVGQRIYPDGDRHLDVMRSGGLSNDEIAKLKSLPNGFGKGMAVAILEIGKTYETTVEERSEPQFQRNVGAFGEDSGKMVTEIKRVEYLKQGVRVSGRGGIFKAEVDRSVIPDGWLD